jgi:hypothetical protein
MHRKDSGNRFRKRSDCKVRLLSKRFGVLMIDEDRATTSRPCTINITPAIPDNVTCAKVNFQLGCCAQDHARSRLSAIARFAVTLARMITSLDSIKQWKRRLHFYMHCFNRFATLRAAAHVGLICDHDQEKFRCFKSRAAVRNVVVQFEILDARWRMGSPVADDGPVEHTIAI